MRFDVITLFPELFAPHLSQGITRRAFVAGAAGESADIDVHLWPWRDFADDAYRRVDDRPYGGGPGMVMLAEPLLRCLAAVRADRTNAVGRTGAATPVLHFTPGGERLNQARVRELAAGPGAVLLCGRYEGIDARVLATQVTHEISLGDFVLSGGELPALVLLDAVARLQPGVLKATSHEEDSFSPALDGLVEGPHYSRPETLLIGGTEHRVPEVLLSGHHGRIARWRREQALATTQRQRPELVVAARAAGCLDKDDEAFLKAL